ncbi:MAG: alpha/beta hydrolase [Gammaproteobacteria bacterium]|nr:MAG: alpha/beta hydrolase [Gammaproteobacteria bacterium]
MQWEPWSFESAPGFVLRGWRTVPRGLPVIHFVHGNGYCGRVYSPFLEALVPHYDLFLSDVQGHGDSDLGPRFLGWHGNARVTMQVWTHFAEDYAHVPVIGMGHSFGGILTLLMASENPSLFDRLVLLDPVMFPPAMLGVMRFTETLGLYKRNQLAQRARQRGRIWPHRAAAWDYFHQRGIFRGWDDRALTAYIDHALKPTQDGQLTLKCPPEREAEIFSSCPAGLWKAVRRLQTTTDILYGEGTYPFVPRGVAHAKRRNPHIHAEVVPGHHCFMQEFPEDTANTLEHLLAGHSTTSA